MSVEEEDIKVTDFLTSLAALAPSLQPLHLGSQGWGEVWEGLGRSGGGGSALSPHKIQAPPTTFLAQKEAWGF